MTPFWSLSATSKMDCILHFKGFFASAHFVSIIYVPIIFKCLMKTYSAIIMTFYTSIRTEVNLVISGYFIKSILICFSVEKDCKHSVSDPKEVSGCYQNL